MTTALTDPAFCVVAGIVSAPWFGPPACRLPIYRGSKACAF